jgi:hypothetical protein
MCKTVHELLVVWSFEKSVKLLWPTFRSAACSTSSRVPCSFVRGVRAVHSSVGKMGKNRSSSFVYVFMHTHIHKHAHTYTNTKHIKTNTKHTHTHTHIHTTNTQTQNTNTHPHTYTHKTHTQACNRWLIPSVSLACAPRGAAMGLFLSLLKAKPPSAMAHPTSEKCRCTGLNDACV